ncbi:MAG: efflux transporter outer membrane subunit [bacterium]
MITRIPGVFLITLIIFAGCHPVGPPYEPPSPDLPVSWHNSLPSDKPGTGENKAERTDWWTLFDDPLLIGLIQKACSDNLSVKDSVFKLKEARARRGIGQADLYPTLDASYGSTVSRSYGETGGGNENRLFRAGLDAGWEMDLFGGNRKTVEKLIANLEASEENLNDIRISIAAEVALNYIDVRVGQERLAVAMENLAIQEETWGLNQARYQAGLSDELSVHQASYNLEGTRARIPVLKVSLEASLNRMAVLTGDYPGSLHEKLVTMSPIPILPESIAIGIPSDTVRARPDIRRAERNLAARTAAVGEANADRYPKLTFSGSLGLSSLTFGNLFDVDNRNYSYGPHISLPIFNAGAIRKNIAVQTAVQEQSLVQYETAVLNAMEEVENAVHAYEKENERLLILTKATSAARQAAKLSQKKYESGLIDFNVVLDSQRSLLTFQDQMVESRGKAAANLVRLYKAMGGGRVSMEKMNNYETRQ